MVDKRQSAPWSLRGILFAQLVALGVLPLLAVAVFMLANVIPQLYEDVTRRQQTLAQSVAGQIETHLGGAERELVSLASMLASEGGVRRDEQTERLLDAVVRKGELYEAIYLVDAGGNVVGLGLPSGRQLAREDLRGIDLSRRNVLNDALKHGEITWSSAFLSAVSGRLTVAVAVPIKGGALVGELALGQLSFFLRNMRAEAGTLSMVLDAAGNVIAHPAPGLAGQQVSLSNYSLVQNVFSQEHADGEMFMDGKNYVGSALKVNKIGWAILVAQPEMMAHRVVDFIRDVLTGGLVLAVMMSLLAAGWVSRLMAGKFGAYAHNASLMARGIYELVWPQTRISEFRTLGGDIQNTANAIKLRESELKASEMRLRATLESTPNVAVQWFDGEGRVVYWNRSSEVIYGISAEDAQSHTLDELIYSREDGEAFQQILQGIAADGKAVGPYESTFRRPDGEMGVVLCTTFAIPGEGDAPRFVCMDIDITRQKGLTEVLEQRERRFRALIEQSPMAIIEWDLRFCVAEWNQAAEQMFGYSRGSALGQHAMFVVPPETHAVVDQVWEYLKANSGGSRSENENITADGRRITCQWYNRPIFDETGELVSVVSLVEDVTDRRRMEQALKASEQKFLSLFHGSPVPVAVSRFVDTVPFTDCNEAWQKEFGWSRNEIFGKTGMDIGLWVDQGQRIALLENLQRNNAVSDFEVQLRRRDGQVLICQMSGRGIGVENEKLIVFAYHNITEERRIQQEIRDLNASLELRVEQRTAALGAANKELKSALENLQRAQKELVRTEKFAALGSLVAGVAHELNTPIGNGLMAVSTFDEHAASFRQILASGSLKRSALDQFVVDAGTATSIIMRNLQKASELVTSFKQVAVDQTSAQRRAFTLEEVVSEILLTLRPSFRRTPFEVKADIPSDLRLDSYPGPFGQVLTNLINNALIHAFEGRENGQVLLLATPLGTNEVRIEVRDDGIGIPEKYLGKVFDPFFTTKLGKGGSGLGLHIVHNIVTRVLGGRLGVSSSPQGTLFWLEIPREAPEANEDIERL